MVRIQGVDDDHRNCCASSSRVVNSLDQPASHVAAPLRHYAHGHCSVAALLAGSTVAPGVGAAARALQAFGLALHDALRVNNGRAAILFTMALVCTFCLPYVVISRPSLSGLAADEVTRLQSQPSSRPEKLMNMILHGDANAPVDPNSLRSQY